MGKTTAIDRLIFTLLIATIIYLIILLGVRFDASSPLTNQPVINLEVTLVKQQTELAPKLADLLAQANNEGEGETEKKVPEPAKIDPLLGSTKPAQPKSKSASKSDKIITQTKAERTIKTAVETAENPKSPSSEVTTTSQLSAQDLIFNARKEAAIIKKTLAHSAAELKKRRLSASTKEYSAAAYVKAWETKVERIGNFNYPQEAKRQGINGSLTLSVDINPDGSVGPNGIVISRSSGHKVLDDAAVKIVRLGAPYAAIPKEALRGMDMITITRIWKFETDHGLSTR